jgi:type II restriction enzyme
MTVPLPAARANGPQDAMALLISRWRQDPGATYQTWFLWDERLKNFGSIRRGLAEVVTEIQADTFGQLAFAGFLHSCACCDTEAQVLDAIRTLDRCGIKGLGPTAANLMYFLHPTITPPFNTAIVNGYNALTGARVKLGRWDEYLAMREGILALNAKYRDRLSNDLGAIAGLLFDIGSKRYAAPPRTDDAAARTTWEADLARVREEAAKADKALAVARDGDRTHTEVQGWLRDLGRALGFDVWVASNDVGRSYAGGRLGDGCLSELPAAIDGAPGADAVRLIDVLWLEHDSRRVAGAFEVEHTTSIYSGIVRLLDLALGAARGTAHGLFLVAPDSRESDVRAQLARPAFSRVADLRVRFLPYGELERHRETMARFGQGMRPVEAVAKDL